MVSSHHQNLNNEEVMMSVNLKLMPLGGVDDLKKEDVYCDTVLRLDADNELIDIMCGFRRDFPGVDAFPIPKGTTVQYCGEEGLVETCHSEVGGRLFYAYAGDFRRLARHLQRNKFRHMSPANRAAIAYLVALPRATPVILNWC